MTDSQPARGSLLPCPFCGGPAEAYSENAFPHHKRSACPKDGCPGTHVVASPEQWNTRVAGGGGEVVTDEAVEHAMEVLIENLDENRHGDVRLGEMYVEEADAYTVAYEIRGAWTVGALGDAMRAALVAALQVKP